LGVDRTVVGHIFELSNKNKIQFGFDAFAWYDIFSFPSLQQFQLFPNFLPKK